jgi:hypothetical protein
MVTSINFEWNQARHSFDGVLVRLRRMVTVILMSVCNVAMSTFLYH